MSETDSKEGDALTIAQWCWPEREWKQNTDATGELLWVDRRREPLSFPHRRWSEYDPEDVGDAERVLIERGLKFRYGDALVDQLGIESDGDGYGPDEIAVAATAPLDARVRAMAAVIRAQSSQ